MIRIILRLPNIILCYGALLVIFNWHLLEVKAANSNKLMNFYEVFISNPITNNNILPTTKHIAMSHNNEIIITACRGQYEAATFTIHALQKIMSLSINTSTLNSDDFSIPSSAMDIRIVKCWFQAGGPDPKVWRIRGGYFGSRNVFNTGERILTPELLLKDDNLIRVDLIEKKNYLRVIGQAGKSSYVDISGPDSNNIKDIRPIDARVLQPVDIDAEKNKQFWLTVHVPEHAPSGWYRGKIRLTPTNAPSSEIAIKLRVLNFTLEKPSLRYAIYYTGKLSHYTTEERPNLIKDGQAAITSEWKSSQQYLADMKNLKAHGIDYPTSYQRDDRLFQQELEIREQAGLSKEALYSLGVATGNPSTAKGLEVLQTRVKQRMHTAQKFGYKKYYFYGMDEADPKLLITQRPAWDAVHHVGGKIFVASGPNKKEFFKVMGDICDLQIYSGTPDSQVAINTHNFGNKIFSYANPTIVPEEPETYRRNYGVLLWKSGYDGAMPFAYQYAYGNIWNDFDHKVRDHAFTYPTLDGAIDTIQWEGFRAGVDDVRYLTTLSNLIQKETGVQKPIVLAARNWLANIDPSDDLESIRSQAIEWIQKLQ